MQIPDNMFKVEVQHADEICIGDYIIGTWNDIYLETFTHGTRRGEVCAIMFPMMTVEDLSMSASSERCLPRHDGYVLVKGVYRLRVPPPEVRGTVIDILEFGAAPGRLTTPQRAIWTDGGRWFSDTAVSVESYHIQRWNLVAAAHKQD